MTFRSAIVTAENFASVTVFIDGRDDALIADATHPRFKEIVAAVTSGEEEGLEDLFDTGKAVNRRFAELGERVTVRDGVVYFDGDPVDNALTKQIVRFIKGDNDELAALVRFFEKIMLNPNEHSREQLYKWIADRDLTITESGNLIAYKGVNIHEGDDEGVYRSVSSGKAVVDGVEHTGQIPQSVGSVVTMPRSVVQHDPRVGCHTGLHAGTWSYASSFTSGPTMTVEINPQDVVSVPTDCDAQKMRVCRYTVTGVTEAPLGYRVVGDYTPEEYDDYGYEDDEDGECLHDEAGPFAVYCPECGEEL